MVSRTNLQVWENLVQNQYFVDFAIFLANIKNNNKQGMNKYRVNKIKNLGLTWIHKESSEKNRSLKLCDVPKLFYIRWTKKIKSY